MICLEFSDFQKYSIKHCSIVTLKDESGIIQESLTYRGQEVSKEASLPPVKQSLPSGQKKEIWKSSVFLSNTCRTEGPWMTDVAFPWTSGAASSPHDVKNNTSIHCWIHLGDISTVYTANLY